MFKVTNKLDINLNVDGIDIVEELKKLKLPVEKKPKDNSNVKQFDFIELAKKLEKGAMISYIAPVELSNKTFTTEQLEQLQKPKLAVDDFYRFFKRTGLGFYQLLPGESSELQHNLDVINDLISKSCAVNLRIEDTETGDIVFEGGIEKAKSEEYKTNKDGERVSFSVDITTVVNTLHPQKKLEIYYPTKK